jgi:hypothetical protein
MIAEAILMNSSSAMTGIQRPMVRQNPVTTQAVFFEMQLAAATPTAGQKGNSGGFGAVYQ